MAKKPQQIRRSESPPGRSGALKKFGLIFDALVLLAAAGGAAVVWFAVGVPWYWLAETLAFGWVPVALFALATLVLLRYRPRLLFRRWRWWISSAAVVAVAVGALSYFFAPRGLFAFISFGGAWGSQVGGYPMPLGIAKLAAIALITPLVLYPKWIGSRIFRSVAWLASYAWLGLKRSWVECRRGMAAFFRWIAPIFNPRLYRRFGTGIARVFSRQPSPSAAEPEMVISTAPIPAVSVAKETSPWDDLADADDQSWEVPPLQPTTPAIQTAPSPVSNAASFTASLWKLPSTELLSPPEPYSVPQTSLEQMAHHIEETLSEHGVMVEVKDIKAGPRIVRFGLVPGWITKRGEARRKDGGEEGMERSRVKVQNILTREKDLALALKTPYLRIEAPVPGEALVGLEVPNPSPGKVPLRKVMEGQPFTSVTAKGGLPIAMGEDTGGTPVVMDLAALPHVLIAGATGSGKSVCINSIVASLLFTKPPDQLRLLMVDPKRVELTPFNGIPHLIAPVIVNVEEVNPALRAVMREMFRRYKLMEEIGTRNIAGYNAKSKDPMPFLGLIIDELADLMMVGGFEIEQNLVRLAQLGRATGIHLVLATQRPSVNVVTGLLKANIPARVAFAVASQVDSRVILDTVGAEKLLGKGDMLLLNNDSPKPRRVQGALVLDEEVDKVVEYWLKQKGPPLPLISIEDAEDEEEVRQQVDDDMLEKARELALRNPHLSPSLLERRLRIGGLKAQEIIEALEDEGLVIPA